VTTVFQRINELADARKREKQETYQPLFGKVYRDNEKITSQISISDHSGQIPDPEALGILNVQDSLTTLTTEHSGLKAAGGDGSVYDEPRPLIDRPNKYDGMKFCKACKAWKLKTLFSPLATTIDGKHTYCRDCRAAKKRANYQPTMRWKRG
jgi:hypothetical protein